MNSNRKAVVAGNAINIAASAGVGGDPRWPQPRCGWNRSWALHPG